MHNNNIKGTSLESKSSQLITILTKPYPYIDKTIQNQFKINGGVGLDKEPQKIEQLMDTFATGAIMGLSTSAFGDIVARRTPIPNQAAPNQDKSVMDMMDEYSKQRFSDPDWYKVIGASSDTALLREMAHMQAYSIWVQNQQFRVQEQQMALLAAMNAIMAKVNTTLTMMIGEIELARAEAAAYAAEGESELEDIELEDEE